MKKYLLLSLLGLLAPALHAHFFAYQEWYNPATGQVLEEYYDLHYPDASIEKNQEQQRTFIQKAAQQGNNVFVITEDMWSHHNGDVLRFDDTSVENKNRIQELLNNDLAPRVLLWLYANCFVRNIPVFNIECRDDNHNDPIPEKYAHEVAAFNDNPTLNHFYASLKKYAEELDTLDNKSYGINFNHRMLVADARALHAINASRQKNIMLAAGASHICSVNNVLLQLGWQPRVLLLPKNIKAADLEKIANWLHKKNVIEHSHILLDTFNNYDITFDSIKDSFLDVDNLMSASHVINLDQPERALSVWQRFIALLGSLLALQWPQ
jgi:hypothetical protein